MRPQQHLSLEKARATFPSDCTCVQPGLLGTANTLSWCLESKGQLGSGLGMVYVVLGEHSLLIGFPFLQGFGTEFKRRRTPVLLLTSLDSRQGSSSPKLFLPAFLKILNVRRLLNDNKST